jgi:hypothetical protein
MKKIKPLITKYKSFKFRSRLEARWAVFFDSLGIKWEYEAEGYALEDCWYLPDFWLPEYDGGIHVEVKHTGGDFSKAMKFTEITRNSIWLCEGPPAPRVYDYVWWDEGAPNICKVIPFWDVAVRFKRFFYDPGYEEQDGTMSQDYQDINPEYMQAVEDANCFDFNLTQTT